MARVPLLERAFGQDRLAHVHRTIGFTSFNLMLAHVVADHLGVRRGLAAAMARDAVGPHRHLPRRCCWPRPASSPGLVVVTSVRAARRRLRYESWHLMHLYAYLGAGLALPHQLWTGQELVSSTGRAVFWWTAWGPARRGAGVAGGAAGVAQPAARAAGHGGGRGGARRRVGRTSPASDLDRLPVEAGQFFTWRFLGRPAGPRANPTRCPRPPTAAACGSPCRRSATAAGRRAALRRGSRVLVEGPTAG